jgi:hypothetical protein
LGQGPLSEKFKNWWPAHGLWWALGFAALYVTLFFINALLSPWVDVVDDRIALLFLPAFVRVAAVVVAKLAGLLGLFVGGLIISLLYGDTIWTALGVSLASATGIFFAYWILLQAMNAERLSLTLPVLLVLTVLYAPSNAIVHAFVWEKFGMSDGITALEIALMMLGDVLGVIAMFFALRLVMRMTKAFAFTRRV